MSWVTETGRRPVTIWLLVIAALVFGMILLGGLTRLTESGLSMVDWRPFMGAVPPLNESAWQATFAEYKAFPQYAKLFPEMTLDEFKFIFLMEYFHRLLGRFIGVAFAFPFLFFLFKRWLYRPFIWRGALLFALGGLQGLIGWYMVKSGLVDIPRVSHYRLALHFGSALLVFSLCLWFTYQLSFSRHPTSAKLGWLRPGVIAVTSLLCFQLLTGAFTAGLRAGYAYNTWPKMHGDWLPASALNMIPLLRNFLDNPVMVQFVHRHTGMLIALIVGIGYALAIRKATFQRLRLALHLTLATVVTQVLLGIGTLVMNVPISLASAHQGVAALLLASLLFTLHQSPNNGGSLGQDTA